MPRYIGPVLAIALLVAGCSEPDGQVFRAHTPDGVPINRVHAFTVEFPSGRTADCVAVDGSQMLFGGAKDDVLVCDWSDE